MTTTRRSGQEKSRGTREKHCGGLIRLPLPMSNIYAGDTRGQGQDVKFISRQHAGSRTWCQIHKPATHGIEDMVSNS